MTETSYQRLHRLAEARRIRLGYTVRGLQALGGPSPAWYTKLPRETGEPSTRMLRSLQALDVALRWPDGTSWRLLSEDRSRWSQEQLDVEERAVVGHQDEIDHFVSILATRLRTYPPHERDDVMRGLLRIVGL